MSQDKTVEMILEHISKDMVAIIGPTVEPD